jgi:hypothetical protein
MTNLCKRSHQEFDIEDGTLLSKTIFALSKSSPLRDDKAPLAARNDPLDTWQSDIFTPAQVASNLIVKSDKY